jgi:hypothetical protein
VVELGVIEGKLAGPLQACGLDADSLTKFRDAVALVKEAKLSPARRSEAVKALEYVSRTAVRPKLEGLTASPVPPTQRVLLASVVEKARPYIRSIVAQANGAYHHRWFDACAVMMRRLVETLIIEVYEARGLDAELRNDKGEFPMLDALIKKAINDTGLNLSRNTKDVLPRVKELGDMSAHNRRFNATEGDVDKLLPKLGAAVQELLHLCGMK